MYNCTHRTGVDVWLSGGGRSLAILGLSVLKVQSANGEQPSVRCPWIR